MKKIMYFYLQTFIKCSWDIVQQMSKKWKNLNLSASLSLSLSGVQPLHYRNIKFLVLLVMYSLEISKHQLPTFN